LRKAVTFIFDLKASRRFRFLSRRAALRRGAAVFIALVACGIVVPAALATSPPELQPSSQPAASSEAGDIAGAATAATAAEDPAAAAATGQSAAPAATPTPAAPDTPTPSPDAAAATDQGAESAATAAQQQPTNVVVIVRENSPGNDGSITQSNAAVGTSNAANDASTTQSGTDNSATTGQDAGSTATVTQDGAGNLVITVRNDSPGKNGSVEQTNGAISASSGTNTSDTDQQAAAPAPIVPPQTRGKGAATSRKPLHRRHRQHTAAARPATESLSAPAVNYVEPTKATPNPPPVHRHPSTARHSGSREHHVGVLSSVKARAAQVLAPFAAEASPVADATQPADASRVVLFTLLALATAGAATFAVRRRAPAQRPASSRRLSR